MIVSAYIGEDPWPQKEDFEVMASKDAAILIEETLSTSKVGETLYAVLHSVEEGP